MNWFTELRNFLEVFQSHIINGIFFLINIYIIGRYGRAPYSYIFETDYRDD